MCRCPTRATWSCWPRRTRNRSCERSGESCIGYEVRGMRYESLRVRDHHRARRKSLTWSDTKQVRVARHGVRAMFRACDDLHGREATRTSYLVPRTFQEIDV